MARRGVWELNEIVLRYCENSGSSRGVREFVERRLVEWAERNPQISFKTVIRGGHPCVYGKYCTGYERAIGLKNKDVELIDKTFTYLRNTLGRRVPKHNEISIGVLEVKNVSAQGFWRNSASLQLQELPEITERRTRLRGEYGLQNLFEEMGMTGVIRITEKLLERQKLAQERALAAEPKEERVTPTE